MVGGFLVLLVASPAAARELYVCSHPDGHISTTTFVLSDPGERARVIAQMVADGVIPGDDECWYMSDTSLPPQSRSDPRRPGDGISQEHRWRRAGQVVIVDPTIKQPNPEAIRREYGRLLPPVRWAEVVATPLGSALDRAVRDGRWADVLASLNQAGAGQPLTVPEIAQLRAILRDYEAD